MEMIGEEPQVTGLSPREGKEGTRITIRGQSLGKNKDDLKSVFICNVDCTKLAEWQSPNKIICCSGNAVGRGDVVVTTYSGGRGSCTVRFTGIREVVDPLKETDKWVDDPPISVEEVVGIEESPLPGYSSYHDYDPLGIAIDEARVGRNKLPVEQVESLYPDGSGDITSENFVPAWYLLEKHRFTSFTDLKAGMEHLEEEVQRRAPGTAGFIKRKLGDFIQCYDTLTDVNGLLIRTDSQHEAGSITDKLEKVLHETSTEGEKIFNSVLSCKRRADITRNALSVLQRYRFLFNLPKTIEMNIKNGEYEIVANDFARARSLFDGTKVEVFKKVLHQVETQIADFRKDLVKKLYTLPSTLGEQKKTIKYLLELDCEGDPAWDCITNMYLTIVKLLQSSSDEFQSSTSAGDASGFLNVSTELDENRGHNRSFSDGSTGWKGGDQSRPKSILFVEELTGLISENLPDLWRLGQTYLNKTLFQGVTFMSEEQQRMAEACPFHRNEFEDMVFKIIVLYSDMVHTTFFPNEADLVPETKQKESLEDSLAAWLPVCVRQLRSCFSSFVHLSLPQNVLNCCNNLSISMRGLCAKALFTHGTEDIGLLHEREDWRVQAEDSGCITSLPLLFENIVVEVLITLKEVVIENLPGEPNECNNQLKLESRLYFRDMLMKFVETLEYLAFQQEEDLHTEMIMKAGSRDHLNASSEALAEEDGSSPNDDQRLMMILSNCQYVRSQVVPRLLDCFHSHGYPSSKDVETVVIDSLNMLDGKLFEEYITKKIDPIEEILEEALDVYTFDYERNSSVKEVPGYVQEVLLNLVLVHYEVYSISPGSVQRVLSTILESITNTLYHKLNDIGEFTDHAAVHAHVELTAFESVLQPYLSQGSYRNFKLANHILGKAPNSNSAYVKQIIGKFRKKTELQLKCFSTTV